MNFIKNLGFTLLLATLSMSAFGQLNTVGTSKPLSFLNPALQNYESEHGVVSLSGVLAPAVQEVQPANYLGIVEFNVNENFRIGVHTNKLENRLRQHKSTMIYASYKLLFEEEKFLTLGGGIGKYTDLVKGAEFNKVFAPNQFYFGADSAVDGASESLDFSFGLSYINKGFTLGFGMNNLTFPNSYLFPGGAYIQDSATKKLSLVDTAVLLEQGSFAIQNNLNLIYTWDLNENVAFTHAVHLANLGTSGIDFFGFQNTIDFNDKFMLGGGMIYNGNASFMLSGGVTLLKKVKLETSAFFVEDLNYSLADRAYISNGTKPMFEFNLRYEL